MGTVLCQGRGVPQPATPYLLQLHECLPGAQPLVLAQLLAGGRHSLVALLHPLGFGGHRLAGDGRVLEDKQEKPCGARPQDRPGPPPAAPRSPPGPAAPVVAAAPSQHPGSPRARSALLGTALTAARSWPAAASAAGGAQPRSGHPAPAGRCLGQPQAPRWPPVWPLHPHPSRIAPPLPPPPSAPASPAPGGARPH